MGNPAVAPGQDPDCQNGTKSALRSLLILAIGVGDFAYNDYLIERWFTNKAVKKTVLAALGKFGLDESAIDAEAYRESTEQLEPLDMRLAELEARRDKILRRIEDHRAGLATRVQTNSDQRVHGGLVLPRAHQTS